MFPAEPVPETLGTYKVLKRLSGTGSTSVYLARLDGPMGFQRNCELKLVPNTAEGDSRFAEELAREAWICSRLNHPAIVRMYDFFEHEEKLVLVLEHVEGVHLDRFLRHLVSRRLKLGDASIYYIMQQVSGALAHAHTQTDQEGEPAPVIHRNIHPGNIVIGWDGQVRVTGFGLGKILGRTPDTVVGTVKGTPGYMAPEQSRGERATTKADIYAVGLLLWAMLAGRRPPVDGSRPAQISTLRPDVPQPVMAMIEAALSPKPEDRKTDCSIIEKTLIRVLRPELGKGELVRCIQSVHATIELEDAGGEDARRPTIPVKAKENFFVKVPGAARLPAESTEDGATEISPDDLEAVEEPAGDAASAAVSPPAQAKPGGAAESPSHIQFGAPPPLPAPPVVIATQVSGMTPAPSQVSAGLSGMTPAPGGQIHFGPPPTLPSGTPVFGAAPSGVPTSGTPSNVATEVTESRSLVPSSRSLFGTVIVSAATATLVAVVWIVVAYRAPQPQDGSATPGTSAAATTSALPTAVPLPPPPVPEVSTRPTAAPEPDAATLPAGAGYLTISFPVEASVYISGRYLGEANGPLQVRCGTWFVRLAQPGKNKYPEWLTKGQTVNVTCQGTTRLAMQPLPGKVP
ncbi:serine/threonine-protein kinase [Chondromyces crocatus]|uniref:Protein kinase domain-containing protein n=1 Tax=Chondromyces crocatus TaxID=52 RepID=A0A0K1ESP7_CHOCO|nr:serine/threonine-protein kinase [Chondromyces crocatus]AKT43824.1 uncharacterized protein CMC5_080610 [Chondromyces crocatus]